ncbi:MAG: MFS transporter, partial [Pseudomonadota bacterium]|nr:MFS transporter [Pseudomonadota bacterium]
MFKLLSDHKFAPLFYVQMFGAFNDNLLKSALITLVTFKLASGPDAEMMVLVAAALFILPFFLFSATAGQLADRYDRTAMIRIVKTVELVLMILAGIGLIMSNVPLLMSVLFMTGVQSAFFGPLKYATIPNLVPPSQLVAANALIAGATFLAILTGQVTGILLTGVKVGTVVLGLLMVTVASIGLVASLYLPRLIPASPNLEIGWNIWRQTTTVMRFAFSKRTTRLAMLGVAWFWLLGSVIMIKIPVMAHEIAGGAVNVYALLLALFAIGIGIGAGMCQRLMRMGVRAGPVQIAALFMSVFLADMAFASVALLSPAWTGTRPLTVLLTDFAFLRLMVDVLGTAIAGGVYVVPLYSLLQTESDTDKRARVIAAVNIMNALFMVGASALAWSMLQLNIGTGSALLVLAGLNALIAIVILWLLPDAVLREIMRFVLRLLYRVEVRGLENLDRNGRSKVYVVNHQSYLDGPLMVAFLPGRPIFAINTAWANKTWFKPFLALVDAFPLDPTKPFQIKTIIRMLESGRSVVIFPEGRITRTGGLMKIYEGPALITDYGEADLVPVHIEGAQYTHFARMSGKLRRRWGVQITVTVRPPVSFDIPDEIQGRERRNALGAKLHDLMVETVYSVSDRERTLIDMLLRARDLHGGDHVILEDANRKPFTYNRFIAAFAALGCALKNKTRGTQVVGVFLPNGLGAALAYFAILSLGKMPAMLNYSAGPAAIEASLKAAGIRDVISARQFLETPGLERAAETVITKSRVIDLVDLKDEMGVVHKLFGGLASVFPSLMRTARRAKPDDPAAILFTSGSEGTPKGVVLTHRNINANRNQIVSVIDFTGADVILNALPIFHSFGLTVGLMLPLLSGVKTVLYVSPLHARIVPEFAYDVGATIILGTDTFLRQWGRAAHPYDFYSVRYVVAGAEKVRDATRKLWSEKFGLRILEGYGATETAPCLSLNTPMHFRLGTVGRMLPGIDWRLERIDGLVSGGRLVVSGDNVMAGYMRVEKPEVIEPPEDGWYDTGDIVNIDPEGFVAIEGRA